MGLFDFEYFAKRLAARDGGRLIRPVYPGSSQYFHLTYVRTTPRRKTPILVIPGGPGLASVVPYRRFRNEAARRGLDVIMVEHRGVGLSGHTLDGHRLPQNAVNIEYAAQDLAAVLKHNKVEKAIVVGSSYGSYLAQVFATRYPEMVSVLILDSPLLSVHYDLAQTRIHRHRLFWGSHRHIPNPLAKLVRQLAHRGESLGALSRIIEVVYELAGPESLAKLLKARLQGRSNWLWSKMASITEFDINSMGVRYYNEPDLVSAIAYKELGYGIPTDGSPLDPQQIFDGTEPIPTYHGEPINLPKIIPHFPWPTVVLSGERDLTTPPAIAQQIVKLAPQGIFVRLWGMGHSALDTHHLALLAVIQECLHKRFHTLPHQAPKLAKLPRKGTFSIAGKALKVIITALT